MIRHFCSSTLCGLKWCRTRKCHSKFFCCCKKPDDSHCSCFKDIILLRRHKILFSTAMMRTTMWMQYDMMKKKWRSHHQTHLSLVCNGATRCRPVGIATIIIMELTAHLKRTDSWWSWHLWWRQWCWSAWSTGLLHFCHFNMKDVCSTARSVHSLRSDTHHFDVVAAAINILVYSNELQSPRRKSIRLRFESIELPRTIAVSLPTFTPDGSSVLCVQ